MKKTFTKKMITATVAFSILAFVGVAGASTKGRIIPTNSVTFHKNDQIIAKFTEQAPINDSALITCEGACSVKLPTMSLNVTDGTTFALRDNNGVINFYIKKGLATFTINNITQQISFYTPDGRYVKSEGFIAPTSTENNVKGFMNVTANKAEIGVRQGGMILSTAEGIQTIDAGYAYKVDLNQLPATGAGAGVVEGTGFSATQIAAGGFVVAAVGTGVAVASKNNDDDTPPQGSQN